MFDPFFRVCAAGLLMAVCVASPLSARAQNGTWTNASSGDWGDTNNWLNGIIADGTNSYAYFSTIDLTADVTVHLDAPRTIGHLFFADSDTNSPADWSLENGGDSGNLLTLAASGAPASITLAGLARGRRATVSASMDLAAAETELHVAPGTFLALKGDVTTSSLASEVRLRMRGPGVCDISGQVFKPTDPGLRKFELKAGVVNFTNALLYCTVFEGAYFTGSNAYASLKDTVVEINPAGQWWGVFGVGGSGGLTSVDMHGGSVSVPGNWLEILGWTGQDGRAIFSLDGNAQLTASGFWAGEVDRNYGVLLVRDASLTFSGGMQAGGAKGAGVIHQLGGSVTSGSHLGMQFRMGQSTAWGIYNLLGGVLTCSEIRSGDGTTGFVRNNTYVNFHGGTLRPGGPSPDFIRTTITGPNAGIAAPHLNVYSGGAVIDTDGHDITINQPLLAPAGQGITNALIAISPGNKGSGYKGAPVIELINAGGDSTGVGATAIANMVDDGLGRGTYMIDSIRITCPGLNYTAPPTFRITGGDASTSATTPVPLIATNASGGLTKQGAGMLTLTATNTYAGDTVIDAGTLELTVASLSNKADLYITSGAQLAIGFNGENAIRNLYVDNIALPQGDYYAGSIAAIGGSGAGYLKVTRGQVTGMRFIVR